MEVVQLTSMGSRGATGAASSAASSVASGSSSSSVMAQVNNNISNNIISSQSGASISAAPIGASKDLVDITNNNSLKTANVVVVTSSTSSSCVPTNGNGTGSGVNINSTTTTTTTTTNGKQPNDTAKEQLHSYSSSSNNNSASVSLSALNILSYRPYGSYSSRSIVARKPCNNMIFKEENITSYTDANGVVYKVADHVYMDINKPNQPFAIACVLDFKLVSGSFFSSRYFEKLPFFLFTSKSSLGPYLE
jgi:hypothetical protein